MIPGLNIGGKDEQGFRHWLDRIVRESVRTLVRPDPVAAVRVYRSTNQLITNGVLTDVSWDTLDSPLHTNMWNAAEPTYLRAPRSGWYHVGGTVLWEAATNQRTIWIVLDPANGGTTRYLARDSSDLSGSSWAAVVAAQTVIYLNTNDRIRFEVFNGAGSAINITANASGETPHAYMYEVR